MAGIAAISTGGAPARVAVQGMLESLCRNPHDASAVWAEERFGLAACWSGESPDVQPSVSEDGRVAVVFDGYLADPAALARALGTRHAQDGALVLSAYERWGDNCAAQIDGEFAFIVIDTRKHIILAARDIQGQRPLYYREMSDGIALASDVATVGAIGEQPEPNRFFLAQIAAAHIVTPNATAWRGIMRVPPASCLIAREGRVTIREYYRPSLAVTRLKRSDADLIAEYRAMLAEAVKSTTRSANPVAFEVSGGLDSSSLFALACGGTPSAPAIHAHTLRGEAGSSADEVAFARAVARHHDVELTEHPLFHPPLDWFVHQAQLERDVPQYPNGAMSLAMEEAMLAQGCRVAINGNGGDQWLDGSRAFVVQNLQALQLGRLLENMGASGKRRALGSAVRQVALAALPDPLRDRLRMMKAGREAKTLIAVPYILPEHAERIAEVWLENQRSLPTDPVARAKLATFRSAWTQFASDMMSRQRAASGIEGRSPMLGRKFIEFCCSLPEDAKLRGSTNRWIHREAMRGLLPEEVRLRETKATFPVLIHPQEVAAYFNRHKIGVLDAIVDVDAAFRVLQDESERSRNAFASWGLFMVQAFLLENEPESG